MVKRALTIAGSDSGGGAGIQADLKTFSAFNVYGMSVITAATAQNTMRVYGVEALSTQFISLQFECVLTDIGIDGVKTGMLFNAEIVQMIAHKFRESHIPFIVVDPVMVAKGGDELLSQDAVDMVRNALIPLATLVTPNIPEAEVLSGISIESTENLKIAAKNIHAMGCKAVLIKGGHLKTDPVDILYDGESFYAMSAKRIQTQNTHGTGCTYSAAILANLIQGRSLTDAVRISKAYVTEAIKRSFCLGKGHGPLNHYVKVEGMR